MKKFIFFISFLVSISLQAQVESVTISGKVVDATMAEAIPYAKVVLYSAKDSSTAGGSLSNEEGLFEIKGIRPNTYYLQISSVGFKTMQQPIFVGDLSAYLDLSTLAMELTDVSLNTILVEGKQDDVGGKMDKKTFDVDENISQGGGSVLQVMKNLPGINIQDGKVQLRGDEKVIILIDGQQSGLTGFGNQSGLENIPASAIERIEIINNPSAKFDANGSAGIINIILKKQNKDGFNGKVGLTGGLGALWIKKENLPTIRPQYQYTPKINPSLALNYRKNKVNIFLQGDYLYNETLNKNEFVTRTYGDTAVINQQTVRNRTTGYLTTKAGLDWNINDQNAFTIYGQYGREKILDNGDQPFFSGETGERLRLWRFLEDEVKTTVVGSANYLHKFQQAGHQYSMHLNYTFHREDEKYFFDNILPTYTGNDAFKLISDEQVIDFKFDYTKPLKHGRLETGLNMRRRGIPTNMQFIPGLNSPLDTNAGGWANYYETIPAIYGNYVYQSKKFEAELGVRMEYADIQYKVNPDHSTYKSDGYNYVQPFPNMRLGYRINEKNKLSVFYNRRVNRPNEVDIRIFPKYDDAEIIKVGNPALQPQFTDAFELGYKLNLKKGYFYSAIYHRITNGTISRIASSLPESTLIYAVFQNAAKSSNSGLELVFSKDLAKWFSLNLNANGYYNQIDAFVVNNRYPVENSFTVAAQNTFSGNAKINTVFHFKKNWDAQVTAIYLAPDIIPQGRIDARFSLDFGLKKMIQNGKGELFLNATDLLNTMNIKQTIVGEGFGYVSRNYYETQVIRVGYSYKFGK